MARRIARDEAEAEDITQETLLQIFDLDASSVVHKRAWLSAVLRNVLAKRRKRERRRRDVEQSAARVELVPSSSEVCESMERTRIALRLLARLKPDYERVLRMRYIEGKTPSEISRELDVPVETIRTRTRRALEKLRAWV